MKLLDKANNKNLFIFGILIFVGLLFSSSEVFAAINPNPPLGPATPYIRNALLNCDDLYEPRVPADHWDDKSSVVQWASAAGNPGTDTIYVDYGTSTINLQYNYVGAVCKEFGPNSNENVLAEARGVFSNFSSGMGGQITQLGGNVAYLNMTGFGGPGNYYTKNTLRRATIPFSYTKPGGFKQNESVTVRFDSQTVGHYKRPRDDRNLYACVNPLGTATVYVGSLYDYGPCTKIRPGFTVNVRIKSFPPPPENRSSCQPFNAAGNFGLPVAQAPDVIAVVDEAGQPLVNKNVIPGQRIRFGVSLKNVNTGSTQWQGFTHKLAMTSPSGSVLYKIPGSQSGIWNVDNDASPKTITLGAANIPTGDTANFWFSANVPVSASGSEVFTFKMIQDADGGQGTPLGLFGASCSITLNIPENRPFLSLGGGDVFSGASFKSNGLEPNSCDPTNGAQSAAIKTNGYFTTSNVAPGNLARINGSSNSQYATFASGVIGDDLDYGSLNTFLGNYGYERDVSYDVKDALFANLGNANDYYGYFYGSGVQTLPCVDISEDEDVASELANNAVQSFLTSGNGGVKKVALGDITINNITIPADGKSKTLIVDGNVRITGSIAYGNGNFTSAQDIPHVKIIAKNIYIDKGQKTIDADLIAMPTLTSGGIQTNGKIDTCTSVSGFIDGEWPSSGMTVSSCPEKLILRGSVVARRVLWKRTFGTLGLKTSVADSGCYFGNYDNPAQPPIIDPSSSDSAKESARAARYKLCSAELIDRNPQSLINGLNNSDSNQNIPTSTTELPPVY